MYIRAENLSRWRYGGAGKTGSIWTREGWEESKAYCVADGEDEEGCGGGLEGAGHVSCY